MKAQNAHISISLAGQSITQAISNIDAFGWTITARGDKTASRCPATRYETGDDEQETSGPSGR
jgi:hypothetical protein